MAECGSLSLDIGRLIGREGMCESVQQASELEHLVDVYYGWVGLPEEERLVRRLWVL